MSEVGMSVNVHVRAETPVYVDAYPAERRATVQIGAWGEGVTLYLRRDELDRLRAALEEARQSLQVPTVRAAA